MASTRKIGDDAEKYVASLLENEGYIVEIHPRTFRRIGQAYISKDNDYHNVFDIKAEGHIDMIYVQVKYKEDRKHNSDAMKKIDALYPYVFPYQRVMYVRVWKVWSNEGRRHKEYRMEIYERVFSHLKGKTEWINTADTMEEAVSIRNMQYQKPIISSSSIVSASSMS